MAVLVQSDCRIAKSLTKNPNPNNYAGGYVLHLYCDMLNKQHGFNEFPRVIDGETFAECVTHARNMGVGNTQKDTHGNMPEMC
jgi:hypothetical protein